MEIIKGTVNINIEHQPLSPDTGFGIIHSSTGQIISIILILGLIGLIVFLLQRYLKLHYKKTLLASVFAFFAGVGLLMGVSVSGLSNNDIFTAVSETTIQEATEHGYTLYAQLPEANTGLLYNTNRTAWLQQTIMNGDLAQLSMNSWGVYSDITNKYSAVPGAAQEPLLISRITKATPAQSVAKITFGAKANGSIPNGTYSGDITYFVKKNQLFTLNFDANTDEPVSNMPNTPVEIITDTDQTTIDIENITPERNQYVFKGWVSDQTAIVPEYQPGEKITLTEITPKTLYAVWENHQNVNVVFNANGGAFGDGDLEKTITEKYHENYIFPQEGISRPNFSFEGWYTEAEGGSQVTSETEVNRTDAHTLYAHWDVIYPAGSFDAAYKAAGKQKDSETGYYTMQDMSSEICNAVASPTTTATQTTTLTDVRDHKVYAVSKLADDRCWMTQNLDFNVNASTTPIKPETSDVTRIWNPASKYYTKNTAYVSSTNTDMYSWDFGDYYYDGNTVASCGTYGTPVRSYEDCVGKGINTTGNAHYHVGTLYQWNAVTAGTGGTIIGTSATDSICPKNWRLPQDETTNEVATLLNAYDAISSAQKIMKSPLFIVPGGELNSGALVSVANGGNYWLSLAHTSATYAHTLTFSGVSDTVYVSSSRDRYLGLSARCIAY